MWYDKCEYYYNNRCILIHKFHDWKMVAIIVVLFPVIVLLNGLYDFKETINDYKKMFNQKKYGSFVEDFIQSNNKEYKEIMNIIKEDVILQINI